jgi:hypothetical protein
MLEQTDQVFISHSRGDAWTVIAGKYCFLGFVDETIRKYFLKEININNGI